MTMLSGLVAVLDETMTRVVEIRDLGPMPVPCQDGVVRPFREVPIAAEDRYRVAGASDLVLADQVVRSWILAPVPLEERWSDMRAERNGRLAASDWTQLADAPLDAAGRAAWAEYRQQLRDITNQPDPWAIAWPSPPA